VDEQAAVAMHKTRVIIAAKFLLNIKLI